MSRTSSSGVDTKSSSARRSITKSNYFKPLVGSPYIQFLRHRIRADAHVAAGVDPHGLISSARFKTYKPTPVIGGHGKSCVRVSIMDLCLVRCVGAIRKI